MTKLKDPPSYAEFKKWVKKQGIKTTDEFKKVLFYVTEEEWVKRLEIKINKSKQ